MANKQAPAEDQAPVLRKIERDENGLIVGVQYTYNTEGTIDWRKMVKPEHLVPNKQKTDETDITKLEDNKLLILLAGLKELAQLRGFSSVEYKVHTANPEYFATVCRITWVPNYETEGKPVVFEAIAATSLNNTESFAKNYLAEIAENRAFCRCVRSFLRINITSKEELTDSKLNEDASPFVASDPRVTLQKLMDEKGLDFERIQKRLIKDGVEKAESFTSLDDISAPTIFELIDRVQNIKT